MGRHYQLRQCDMQILNTTILMFTHDLTYAAPPFSAHLHSWLTLHITHDRWSVRKEWLKCASPGISERPRWLSALLLHCFLCELGQTWKCQWILLYSGSVEAFVEYSVVLNGDVVCPTCKPPLPVLVQVFLFQTNMWSQSAPWECWRSRSCSFVAGWVWPSHLHFQVCWTGPTDVLLGCSFFSLLFNSTVQENYPVTSLAEGGYLILSIQRTVTLPIRTIIWSTHTLGTSRRVLPQSLTV